MAALETHHGEDGMGAVWNLTLHSIFENPFYRSPNIMLWQEPNGEFFSVIHIPLKLGDSCGGSAMDTANACAIFCQ